MASTYKTPGVYVEEISKFPPSVAQVETAIPAFIGYTKQAIIDGQDYHATGTLKPIKISSLPDFEFLFGGAPDPTTIEIDLSNTNEVNSVLVNGVNFLYDSIRMFYTNGGGDCYVVSVGGYNTTAADVDKQALLNGLATLEKVDRPTLLVIPESVHLDVAEAGEIHAAMLAQCNKLQDRFAVLDIVDGDAEISPTKDPVEDFRSNVGMNFLKYGAAYYPWIKTSLSFPVSYDAIVAGTFTQEGNPIANITSFFNSDMVTALANKDADITTAEGMPTTAPSKPATPNKTNLSTYANEIFDYLKEFFDATFTDSDVANPNASAGIHARYVKEGSTFHSIVKTLYDYLYYSDATNGGTAPSPAWDGGLLDTSAGNGFNASEEFSGLTISAPANTSNDIFPATSTAAAAAPFLEILSKKMDALLSTFKEELKAAREQTTDTLGEVDPVYKRISEAISNQKITLPPSGAIVGVYAMVDNNRGVWKAPANVSLSAMVAPTVNITHEEQQNINVDVTAGKSINAIRTFTGKGHMVWGARTLAGNDNEWRYISVRRFYNMAEESIKKATEVFVFEPNDANTWVKVRAMIENFLILQWRAGALAGAKPEQAFYVRVGLGETMTADDVNNGIMNVEIGMAVVRPAEFIILKFSHKMQEA